MGCQHKCRAAGSDGEGELSSVEKKSGTVSGQYNQTHNILGYSLFFLEIRQEGRSNLLCTYCSFYSYNQSF